MNADGTIESVFERGTAERFTESEPIAQHPLHLLVGQSPQVYQQQSGSGDSARLLLTRVTIPSSRLELPVPKMQACILRAEDGNLVHDHTRKMRPDKLREWIECFSPHERSSSRGRLPMHL